MPKKIDDNDEVKEVKKEKTGKLPKNPILFGPAITDEEKVEKRIPDQEPNVCA